MIDNAAKRETAANTNPTVGIGGPQTSEDKPAVVVSEIIQAMRTGRRNRFQ
jgi:hypothetical protein